MIRRSRQSQGDISATHHSSHVINDLVIDVMADSSAVAPMNSDKSVIYTPGQQFLLSSSVPGSKAPLYSVKSLDKSLDSDSAQVKRSSSQLAKVEHQEHHEHESDSEEDGDQTAALPTTENLAQLQVRAGAQDHKFGLLILTC